MLFDATALPLELPESSRELLEYAALLHDIGHAIDHDRHNRHSYYLVKKADLLGYEPVEIEMIALALRAHRKQSAQLDSPEWEALSAGYAGSPAGWQQFYAWPTLSTVAIAASSRR